MEHVYLRCTQSATGKCAGCRDGERDCRFESLSICTVCGGMEGSLLPECPGRWLMHEEDQANYEHYCNGTGPFAKAEESRCEREEGHEGPHLSTISASSRRIWPVKINYVEDDGDDCREAQDNASSKGPFTP